jgi:hypothetical protein
VAERHGHAVDLGRERFGHNGEFHVGSGAAVMRWDVFGIPILSPLCVPNRRRYGYNHVKKTV